MTSWSSLGKWAVESHLFCTRLWKRLFRRKESNKYKVQWPTWSKSRLYSLEVWRKTYSLERNLTKHSLKCVLRPRNWREIWRYLVTVPTRLLGNEASTSLEGRKRGSVLRGPYTRMRILCFWMIRSVPLIRRLQTKYLLSAYVAPWRRSWLSLSRISSSSSTCVPESCCWRKVPSFAKAPMKKSYRPVSTSKIFWIRTTKHWPLKKARKIISKMKRRRPMTRHWVRQKWQKMNLQRRKVSHMTWRKTWFKRNKSSKMTLGSKTTVTSSVSPLVVGAYYSSVVWVSCRHFYKWLRRIFWSPGLRWRLSNSKKIRCWWRSSSEVSFYSCFLVS